MSSPLPAQPRSEAQPASPTLPTAGGLTWRPWNRRDVPALAALMRVVQEADGRDWFTP
ncbi:hypothetical protein [Myceligenerans halotolerans]